MCLYAPLKALLTGVLFVTPFTIACAGDPTPDGAAAMSPQAVKPAQPKELLGVDEVMSRPELRDWMSKYVGDCAGISRLDSNAGERPLKCQAASHEVEFAGPVLPGSHPPAPSQLLHNNAPRVAFANEKVLTPHGKASGAGEKKELTDAQRVAIDMAHAAVYQDDPYPSAKKCATCHPGHFREWSTSPHAYAQLSPVFNAMSSKLNVLNNGTLGDFCIRCHTPVGMALGEPMVMSNMDRHPTSREGVTCVVCHRINKAWGKGSGRLSLVAAGLEGPIYGTLGSEILAEAMADPEKYGVLKTDPTSNERGRLVHDLAVPFFQLHTSGFCGACHDVFAPNGFRLEDAFSEYKASPAAREKQQSCQDCHMGEVPGVAAGYRIAPIAKVGNEETRPRKRTNHMMAGPDYSIIHPGLFPHNSKAIKEEHSIYAPGGSPIPGLATMREWLQFDHESGWGSPAFERSDAAKQLNQSGPTPWRDPARRFKAHQILEEQFELLGEYTEARRRVLANGFGLSQIECESIDRDGLKFRVLVYNKTDGHGVPTGFDAERVIFLRTMVFDARGKILFVSGDLDPNGDIRDSHSVYVHNGILPQDPQLFTLQSRFITRNIRGGEREQVLNVPFSLDPLPYVRPEVRPFTILGRPVGARKHKQNLAANDGKRWAKYHVAAERLSGCKPYFVSVQLIEGMVPVNLIHEIESVGFDYGMSAREIAENVVNGHIVIQQRQAQFGR